MTAALAQRPPQDRLIAGAATGLSGRIVVPGDKSMSHRALILAALASGETVIDGLLESDDVLATAAALRALGRTVTRDAGGRWRVEGGAWSAPDRALDCGNSGTAARLLMGAAAGFAIGVELDGDASLRTRPMRRVTEPLEAMGARIDGADRLPLRITGGSLRGISYRNERASAQVKSAILLAGLRADGPVTVIEPRPSRDHSEIMLRAFGCDVEASSGPDGVTVSLGKNRRLRATHIDIPGDPSSAAFPIVAALVTPDSEVTVSNVLLNPLRTGLFDTLIEMGADISTQNVRISGGERIGDLVARSSRLHGIEITTDRAPSMIDEYPILAVAAAVATGETVMRGLAELRHKESDRLAAIVLGLRACGVDAREMGDDLIVSPRGRPGGGASVETHGDHRIAMAFLTLGLASTRPIAIDRPDMIATSFPDFAGLMRSIGAQLSQ